MTTIEENQLRGAKRVLVLGKNQEMLESVIEPLEAIGFAVQGSIAGADAANQFDAKDFDLIVFGSGLLGPVSDRLRLEFFRQNPDVGFLDTFGPIAVKQTVAAIENDSITRQYVTDFHVGKDGPDYLMLARILKPCTVTIEVYRLLDAPPSHMEIVDESDAIPGPFERRFDGRHDGHMLVMTVNDSEYHLYRMST